MDNNECKSSKKVLNWLVELDKTWERREESPNCFYSDKLEALYVYEAEIRYWNDIRCHDNFLKFPIPKTKLHLAKYLNTKELDKEI